MLALGGSHASALQWSAAVYSAFCRYGIERRAGRQGLARGRGIIQALKRSCVSD
jgi:hypothetical protein